MNSGGASCDASFVTTTRLEEKISRAVQRLIREHLAECEEAAAGAVREAFARAAGPLTKERGSMSSRRKSSSRRTSAETTRLVERLFKAICEHPGETMAVIAPTVGSTPRELEYVSKLLRRSGRVRSVGQRQNTRYFPMEE